MRKRAHSNLSNAHTRGRLICSSTMVLLDGYLRISPDRIVAQASAVKRRKISIREQLIGSKLTHMPTRMWLEVGHPPTIIYQLHNNLLHVSGGCKARC